MLGKNWSDRMKITVDIVRQVLKYFVSKYNWILREVLGKNWKDRMKITGNKLSGIKVKLELGKNEDYR